MSLYGGRESLCPLDIEFLANMIRVLEDEKMVLFIADLFLKKSSIRSVFGFQTIGDVMRWREDLRKYRPLTCNSSVEL